VLQNRCSLWLRRKQGEYNHANRNRAWPLARNQIPCALRLVATAAVDRVSTTIWSGGAAAGLYLGTGLILAFLVHTHYPGALGMREWIRVVLSWPLIFFLRSK